MPKQLAKIDSYKTFIDKIRKELRATYRGRLKKGTAKPSGASLDETSRSRAVVGKLPTMFNAKCLIKNDK